MDVSRRNLMKGVLTGGALLALGIPPGAFANAPARRTGKVALLLGNTPVDTAFEAGIRSAYSAQARAAGIGGGVAGARIDAPQVVKLNSGLLHDYEEVAGLLEKNRNTRWIAAMDDGSAAVFMELARNAGARLVLLGSHVSSGDDISMQGTSVGIPLLRHVWAAASPAHSGGEILASRLVENPASFSIVENFLTAEHLSLSAQADRALINKVIPGFLTYRLDGPDPMHLHCSGLSSAEGCELLGWNTAGRWAPVSYDVSTSEATASAMKERGQPQYAGWVESVGYAVMAAALGAGSIRESCSSRAFMHQDKANGRGGRAGPAERFTSFVVDI